MMTSTRLALLSKRSSISLSTLLSGSRGIGKHPAVMPAAHIKRANIASLVSMFIRLNDAQAGTTDISQEMTENFKVREEPPTRTRPVNDCLQYITEV
jgi:hypothetical protein